MCVTHVPWYMSESLTRGGGENVPGIPGACATRNFTHLARGPWRGAVLLTSLTSLAVPVVAIVTAQKGRRVVAVAAPSPFDFFHELYLHTGNYDHVIHAYHCINSSVMPLSVWCCQHWFDPSRSHWGALWHTHGKPMDEKLYNCTGYEVVPASLHLRDGICASGKLALADIVTRSTSGPSFDG